MMYKIGIKEASNGDQNFNPWQNNENANVIDRNSVSQFTVKVNSPDQLREAADLISRILKRRHYGVKDYEIILPEQLLQQKQKTQRIFNIVMGAIAGISLLVGGIGIMNIMLANIMERTREIGVRRAVGATRMDILSQFVYEALTIRVVGGLTGIILGFILTSLITNYAEWKTIISPFSVFLAFFVSVATGLIFGIYPAKQAADKNPIESLRYE
jgi:putative ABC transport system permease protein